MASVAVVITARAPLAKAQRSASSLAPPRWPESSEMANLPASSMTTTAGSVSFDSSSGAIMRTTMPVAMISTKPSYLFQREAIRAFSSAGSKQVPPVAGLTGVAPGDVQLRAGHAVAQPSAQQGTAPGYGNDRDPHAQAVPLSRKPCENSSSYSSDRALSPSRRAASTSPTMISA